MRAISKDRAPVFFGLLMYGSLALAQGSLPGDASPTYRPLGTLVFRQSDSELSNDSNAAAMHASYVIYISALQGALLDTNPKRVEQQAEILEISSADVERVYLLLQEFNTRLSSSRRSILTEECGPLLAGRPMTNTEVEAAVARIDSDEPREEILQSVLQNIRDTFGDDVVGRMQRRVNEISMSPQFARLQEVEQKVRVQSGGDLTYLNEQCAILKE